MNKRNTLKLALCALALAASGQALAADAPLVAAPKSLESLCKDIVLDRPGAAPATGNARRRGPVVDLQVQFAFNSADLLPHGQRQLDQLAQALNSKALITWGFELAGHTDRVGAADYNVKLSLERATAVKNYLVVTHGINAARLVPIGLGYSRPADPANPAAAINRRVEVRKVALAVGAATAPVLAPGPAAVPLGQTAPARPGGRLVPTP